MPCGSLSAEFCKAPSLSVRVFGGGSGITEPSKTSSLSATLPVISPQSPYAAEVSTPKSCRAPQSLMTFESLPSGSLQQVSAQTPYFFTLDVCCRRRLHSPEKAGHWLSGQALQDALQTPVWSLLVLERDRCIEANAGYALR